MNHESKCRNLHGHSYIVEIEAAGVEGLDQLGRVVDFSVLKEKIGGWIDEHWDHGFLVYFSDAEALFALQRLPGQKVYRMPTNPTAENIAAYLLEISPRLLGDDSGVFLTRVVVHETGNCKAEARRA